MDVPRPHAKSIIPRTHGASESITPGLHAGNP